MNKKYKIEFPKELCSVIDPKLLKFNHVVVFDSGVWNQDDEMFFDGDGIGKYIPRVFLKEVDEIQISAKDHATHILNLERRTQTYKEALDVTETDVFRIKRIESIIFRVSEEGFKSGSKYEKKSMNQNRALTNV